MHIYRHTCAQLCTFIQKNNHRYIYTHARRHTHTHAHIYTNMFTHTTKQKSSIRLSMKTNCLGVTNGPTRTEALSAASVPRALQSRTILLVKICLRLVLKVTWLKTMSLFQMFSAFVSICYSIQCLPHNGAPTSITRGGAPISITREGPLPP